jgi:hypothetical protein
MYDDEAMMVASTTVLLALSTQKHIGYMNSSSSSNWSCQCAAEKEAAAALRVQ